MLRAHDCDIVVACQQAWRRHNIFTRCAFASEEIAGLPVRFKGKHGNFFRLFRSLARSQLLTAASKQRGSHMAALWEKYNQNRVIVLATQALVPVNCLATHLPSICPASPMYYTVMFPVVLVQKDRAPRVSNASF
jgi:hypothetical protein